jgi:ligand-binding SRPBCC domain-containing protein
LARFLQAAAAEVGAPRLRLDTYIAAPPEVCFDLSRDVDRHVAWAGSSGERAVAGVTSGRMALGDEVTWEARHFGVSWRMTSRIVAYDRSRSFVDEMQRGPFRRWRHMHRFEPAGQGTLMVDEVEFASPLPLLGRLADLLVLGRYMRRLLQDRNAQLKRDAEALASAAVSG